jgi:hypothetical protein
MVSGVRLLFVIFSVKKVFEEKGTQPRYGVWQHKLTLQEGTGK